MFESSGLRAARMITTAQKMPPSLCVLVMGCVLHGCGLLMDAAHWVQPILPDLPDELDVICRHKQLHVGIANEPSPPFVFPAVRTDDGLRITGLDIELVQIITAVLSKHCGDQPITAVPSVLPFRGLFIQLTEGKLDLFVSAMAANVPHLIATGIGYSTPYFYDTGIIGITRKPPVAEHVRAAFRRLSANEDSLDARKAALTGFNVAVQEGRSPHLYTTARLKGARLVICDTLSAAFESQDPSVDIILGKEAILGVFVRRERQEWRPLARENGQPFLLAREHYAIAMAESNYRLRWLVNDVLFELEQSGRLAEMRRRWFDQDYASSPRVFSEGLLCTACEKVQTNESGRCHWATGGNLK